MLEVITTVRIQCRRSMGEMCYCVKLAATVATGKLLVTLWYFSSDCYLVCWSFDMGKELVTPLLLSQASKAMYTVGSPSTYTSSLPLLRGMISMNAGPGIQALESLFHMLHSGFGEKQWDILLPFNRICWLVKCLNQCWGFDLISQSEHPILA